MSDVNIDGAELIARLAAEKGVEKLIHMSTLNASEDPEATIMGKSSNFLKTKVNILPSSLYNTRDFQPCVSNVGIDCLWQRTVGVVIVP